MRLGLLSDIHANIHALQVAVAALAEAGTDRYVVAGDIVGYGPHPNECVAAVRDLPGLVAVAGNHELLTRGIINGARLPRLVTDSIDWTRATLTETSMEFLAGLPTIARLQDVVVAHGALDNVSRYVSYPYQAREELQRLGRADPSASILVLGHTHVPWTFGERRGTHRIGRAPIRLDPAVRHLVNPGSVGQSRQREHQPRARFAQLDMAARTVTFWALHYDHDAARRSLRSADRPEAILHLKPALMSTIGRPVRQHLSRLRHRGMGH